VIEVIPPPKGEGGARSAPGGDCTCRNRLPHPTSLGYRLRSATLPEDGEG
jgi:hypothetical protein